MESEPSNEQEDTSMADRKRKKSFTVTPLPPGFTHPREWCHITVDTDEEAAYLSKTLGIPMSQIWSFDLWMRIAKEYWAGLEQGASPEAAKQAVITKHSAPLPARGASGPTVK